jgi:hypothetical protein
MDCGPVSMTRAMTTLRLRAQESSERRTVRRLEPGIEQTGNVRILFWNIPGVTWQKGSLQQDQMPVVATPVPGMVVSRDDHHEVQLMWK